MKKMFIFIGIIIVIAAILFEFLALIIYGNKPVGEVPFWVLWFLLGD